MLTRLARSLQLEPAEFLRALRLGGLLFALTSSYTLVKTARDALFLSTLPASALPWVFLGVGALTLVSSVAWMRATQHRGPAETLAAGALVAALVLAAFAWAFGLEAPWVPVAFYLWVNLYGLILMSQFWVFTNSVSNAAEAKRIFGPIGTGGVLGGLAGGLLSPMLANAFGLPSLLVVAALLMAALGWSVLGRLKHQPLRPAEPAASADSPARPLAVRYVRWLAAAALCSVLVTSLLDLAFKIELQRRYPSPEQLATFLGAFYTVVNLASLGIQLFVTRWALQALGAGWSAAVLPTGLGLAAALNAFVPGFATVLSARLWDQVMRQSLNRSAVELFYFPLEPGLRRRARAFIDSGLERVGDGLAGLVVIGLAALAGMSGGSVLALVGVLVAAWVAAWLAVRRGYVEELGKNLRRLNLAQEHEPVSLREASLIKEMLRLLESPYERIVIQGVAMLEANAPELLDERLAPLLDHASPAVRARALAAAATLGRADLLEHMRAKLHDPDPEVRVAALRAQCALDQADATATVEEFMDSPDPALRIAALQVLVERCPPLEEMRARDLLERHLREDGIEARRSVAAALGRRPGPSMLHDLLGPLLEDPDLETRRAALESAGRAQRRTHIPALLDALAVRATRDAARAGLAAWGDKVAGTLGDYLADSTVEPGIRHYIPRVLADIGTQEAANALIRFRDPHDVRLGYRVLKAMNRIRVGDRSIVFPRDRVSEDLEADVRSAYFAYVHYRACPIGPRASAERLFCVALNERVDQAVNRVFRRLALIYPPDTLLAAYRGVVSDDGRARGNALEFLENALAPEHRNLVLTLVDDSGDEARLRYGADRFGFRFESFEGTLEAVLAGEDQWLRTCALYVIGARRDRTMLPGVMEALSARDPRVRETANWATMTLAAAPGG